MRVRFFAAAAAVTALGALLAPGPAGAEIRGFADARGDVAHGVDLWRVKVVNEKRVRVVLQHDDLVRSFRSGASMSLFLDTDPAGPGPEFVLTSGLFEGTDYALLRTRGWQAVGAPLTCSHSLRLDYAADRTYVGFGRGCLGRPEEVRVAVKAAGERPHGTVVTDWYQARRAFTGWVQHG